MKEFVGKDIKTLRTPALIVDRSRFKENCERVTKETERRGMGFRAHVKSESGCGGWIWYLTGSLVEEHCAIGRWTTR